MGSKLAAAYRRIWSVRRSVQAAFSMPKGKAVRTRKQVAALPLRLDADGRLEVLLVTSRETKRWIVPKGWPMKGRKDHRAAAVEAWEEAGMLGRMLRRSVGSYSYWKRGDTHFELCRVAVYAMAAEKQAASWKEKGQREVCWFGAFEAADRVLEPELSTIIVNLPSDEEVMTFLRKSKRWTAHSG
ncbi:NUDIX hydrolase [Mangrovicella endophytica]|uniref:NUDIX hydrolase n=1 Tax=Mangrovicella endophytica TaxID=2066697 RepID=UPI001FE20B64|nr:NUDIX hydrolase [Mangrovicella endophytica]